MHASGLVGSLIIGAVAAGWRHCARGCFGLPGNVVVGMRAARSGDFLPGFRGVAGGGGLAGSVVSATPCAVVLLSLVGLIRKR